MDGPQAANSGHPGTAMALAPLGWTLYGRIMKHNPANPKWADRDRFILSCGHACILQYSCLHLAGYDLTLDDLKNFRQWESRTPGHPESWITPGIEATTGPLGQGVSNAVGFAMAERFLGAHFNRPDHTIVDHHTYVIASDGDLMEGVASESASLAGHQKLGKLIVLYDDNHITIEGETELAFTENVDERYRAYGWHVQRLASPDNLDEVQAAIEAAQKDPRPSLIAIRTHIASPAPNAIDTHKAHGSPLGAKEISATKAILGLPDEPFYVPSEVDELRKQIVERGKKEEADWTARFEAYSKAFPELAKEWEQFHTGRPSQGWDSELKYFPADEKGMATRASSGKVIQQFCKKLPNLLGGSADLAPSTNTLMEGIEAQSFEHPEGRNLHFGVREHAMGALTNGLLYHGGLKAYCATFFIFSDYMRPTVRLAALARLPSIFLYTHDSIGLGEDGPTHQAVEHLAAMRAMPNLWVIRPADANEVLEMWKVALNSTATPVAMVLSRQEVPTFDRSGTMAPASGLAQGAYILEEAEGGSPQCILIGTGSEVQHCLKAREILQAEGTPTRVVSMPCWELFEEQNEAYKHHVLPPDLRAKVAVETGVSMGWERYVGAHGKTVTMHEFGHSAPAKTLMEQYGFTPDNVAAVARAALKK